MFEKRSYLADISRAGNLSKEEYRLLLYILGRCDADYSVCVTLSQLAEFMAMAKPNVSRAITALCGHGVIVRTDGKRESNAPMPIRLALSPSLVKRYYTLEDALFDEGYSV